MDYGELIRKQLLSDMLSKMSDEEKRELYGLVLNGRGQQEIKQLLLAQRDELRAIRNSQSWLLDFGANIAGNAVWDSLVWVGGKLFRKL